MDVIETDTADVQVNSAGATSYVNNYKIMNMLGEGTFSKVYLCQNDAGDEFALKVINKSILKRKREYKRVDGKLVLSNAFQKVQKEVAIMKKLAHSNLVRLYEVIDSPGDDKLFLVLELIRGGQIMYWDDKKFRYFTRNTPTGILSKDTVRECLRDVVAALDFLHRNHICHRDIKPENILLAGDQYKLADFGVAYMKDDEPTAAARPGDPTALKLRSTEGTYHFLAPECTTGEEYDPYQVDVWALGVTMFTLLLGTLPFGTSVASLSDVMTSIREDPLILPPELDVDCAELLAQLMEKNPRVRITVPQLRTHPWVSGGGGELARRPSGLEIMVTQQEIEAAFTPVNNFILVMKLKMKMSSRLNKVRKSLAGNANGARCPEAVPVTLHVPVSSFPVSEANSNTPKAMEMAPCEQSRVMPDRLQRRSSRLVESISESMGSLSSTLTRRKSQLGTTAPVFDGAAPTASSPESSPGKVDTNGRPSVLLRKMSRRSSRSVLSLIPDTSQCTDSARAIKIMSSEDGLSPDKSEGDDVASSLLRSSCSNSLVSLNGKISTDKSERENPHSLSHRLTKRKSSSFRGFIRAVEIPEGENASETASPTMSKKRRESLPGKNDPSSIITAIITAKAAAQHAESGSPVAKDTSPSKVESSPLALLPGGLTRRNSMSYRALAATPELSTAADVDASPSAPSNIHGVAAATQGSDASIPLQATTRPVMLSRRLSRRNSRSFRGLSTAPDAIRSGEASKETGAFPIVARKEHSLSKVDFSAPSLASGGIADGVATDTGEGDQTFAKPESTSPSRGLSRRNSTSFKVLVSMPVDGPKEGNESKEVGELSSLLASNKGGVDEMASSQSKYPGKSEPNGSPGLLARRLSQSDSTCFRAPPLKVDVIGGDENAKQEVLTSRTTLSKLSPGKNGTDNSNHALEATSPIARSVDVTHSLQMNSSRSPLSCPKMKISAENDEMPLHSVRKAKLPVLDILSPISSPVTSPASSPRRAADLPQDEGDSDRAIHSSPTKTTGSPRGHSTIKVSPLLRKRSSSLRLDGFSSSSEDDKLEEPASTPESDSNAPPTVVPDSLTANSVKSAPLDSETPDASDRRGTLSTAKPTSPLPERDRSPQSPPRRLHRNRSISSCIDGDDPNGTLMRKTSLAKVLDECISTGRESVEDAPSTDLASPEAEVPVSLLTPTRRHPMHVPPIIRHEDQAVRQTQSTMSRGYHHHQISPLGSPEKPSPSTFGGSKSPPPMEESRSRRKSLIPTQDSLRSLFRGQSSVRLSMLDEKRGAHCVSDDKVSRIKSKVCAVM